MLKSITSIVTFVRKVFHFKTNKTDKEGKTSIHLSNTVLVNNISAAELSCFISHFTTIIGYAT